MCTATLCVFRLSILCWLARWVLQHKHEMLSFHYCMAVMSLFVLIVMSAILFCRLVLSDFFSSRRSMTLPKPSADSESMRCASSNEDSTCCDASKVESASNVAVCNKAHAKVQWSWHASISSHHSFLTSSRYMCVGCCGARCLVYLQVNSFHFHDCVDFDGPNSCWHGANKCVSCYFVHCGEVESFCFQLFALLILVVIVTMGMRRETSQRDCVLPTIGRCACFVSVERVEVRVGFAFVWSVCLLIRISLKVEVNG